MLAKGAFSRNVFAFVNGGVMTNRHEVSDRPREHVAGTSPTRLQISATSAVRQIAERLSATMCVPIPGDEVGFSRYCLASGAAGIALALAYVGEALHAPPLRSAADRHLRFALAGLAEVPAQPKLFEGLWGVLWVERHLRRRGLIAGNVVDTEIDELANRFLASDRPPLATDLLVGPLGVGVLAAEGSDIAQARASIDAVIQTIDRALNSAREQGLAFGPWTHPPASVPPFLRRHAPQGFVDLGLAHGVSGTVAALSQWQSAGLIANEAMAAGIVADALDTILLHRGTPGVDRYPGKVMGTNRFPPRLGWCTGLLSVGVAFALASEAYDRSDWRDEANDLLSIASNLTPSEGRVIDGSLCHGSVGIAVTMRRLADILSRGDVREASERWLTYALEATSRDEHGHYLTEVARPDGRRFEHLPGFLTGEAGFALGSLAAARLGSTAWDRILLLSAPDRTSQTIARASGPPAG